MHLIWILSSGRNIKKRLSVAVSNVEVNHKSNLYVYHVKIFPLNMGKRQHLYNYVQISRISLKNYVQISQILFINDDFHLGGIGYL